VTLAPEILADSDFQRLAKAVHAYCGINLHEGKRELVQARLTKLLRNRPYASAREYLDHVLNIPEQSPEFVEFIDSLSTNLTSFFRESEHFDYLAGHFLPRLLERRKSDGSHRIRAWSAASSTGEEPYSIAMTIQHALDAETSAWDALVLATDISTRVLKIAREGVYDPKRTEPVPQHLASRYLAKARGPYPFVQPIPKIRDMVRFAHLNLLEPWPFKGPLDFVFCRNVMIYFDKPTQQKLIDRFFDVIGPGGLLFTGHSESLTGIDHRFAYVHPTIYLKK
jgi:chemotaxis protein methyltransferase CheR